MRNSPLIHLRPGWSLAWPAMALVCAFTLSSCSSDSPSDPGQVAPVPQAASMLDIQSPAVGAMLAEGTQDPSPVEVTGSVCDSTVTVASLLINGTDQLLSGAAPCFDFATTVESRWGLNTLEALVTTDNGVASNFVRSYLRSPDYFAPPAPPKGAQRAPTSMVPAGVVVRMTQDFMDDGTRFDGNAASVDDLATLFQMAVRSVNLASVIGSTLLTAPSLKTCNCLWPIPDITIHGNGAGATGGTLSWSPARVLSLNLQPGGAELTIQFSDFALPISVTGYLGECVTSCVDRADTRVTISGDLYLARATATTRLDIGLGPDGQPAVSVHSNHVELENLEFDINWGPLEFLDGIANYVTSLIIDYFRATLQSEVAGAISAEVPALTRAFLEGYRPPTTLDLPAPFSQTLRIQSVFDRIEFDTNQAVIGVAASIEPAIAVAAFDTGSIERGGAAPSFAGSTGNLAAGIKDDLLNQYLYAAWASGALNIDDLSEFTCGLPEGTDLHLSLTLPPVIMPGSGSAPMDVGVGDLHVSATLSPSAAARYGASAGGEVEFLFAATAGATLELDPESYHFGVTLDDDYDAALSILSAPEGADLEALATEYDPTLRCVLGEMLERLLNAYPMPVVPIGLTGIAGIPADAAWQMGSPELERQPAYIAVSGDVELR